MFLTIPAHNRSSEGGQVHGLHHGTFFCPSNRSMASPDFSWENSNRQTSAYTHSLKIPSSLRRAEGWTTLTEFATSRWMNWRSVKLSSQQTRSMWRDGEELCYPQSLYDMPPLFVSSTSKFANSNSAPSRFCRAIRNRLREPLCLSK